MPASGAHGFLWAIQDQQASGQLQSSRQEDHRALLSTSSLPSTASLPFTYHLPEGLHSLAVWAPEFFCQTYAMV